MKIIKKKPKVSEIINLIVFLLIIVAIVIVSIKFGPSIKQFYGDTDGIYEMATKTSDFLKGTGYKSVFIFVGIQILQVVIAVIPGMAIQFAGGMVYGIFMGVVYSLIGQTIGSLIVFYISRIFGKKAVALFIKPETYEKFKHLAETKKAGMLVFVLFLIPGLPKDVFSYILGLSPLKVRTFLLYSTIGRIPGVLGSCIIGYTYVTKNYLLAGVVLGVSAVILVLCLIFKKKIMALISHGNVV